MEHRVTFKTPNGVLQEKLFDNFNEFADTMDETIYDNLVRREKVTNGESASEHGGMEFLSEDNQQVKE